MLKEMVAVLVALDCVADVMRLVVVVEMVFSDQHSEEKM
jgi:hypothetical protein